MDPVSVEMLRIRAKLLPYKNMLMYVQQSIDRAQIKKETSCVIPLNLPWNRTGISMMIEQNKLVTETEFTEILQIAYPGCNISYKEQIRPDKNVEAAYTISWA